MKNKQNYQSDKRKFEELIRNLFNAIDQTESYQLFVDKAQEKMGLNIFSQETRTGIQCYQKDTTKSDSLIFRELMNEIKTNAEKPLRANIELDTFIFVSTYKDDELLQEFIKMLKEKNQYPYEIYYWGWDTIAAYLNQYQHLVEPKEAKEPVVMPKYLTEIPPCKPDRFIGREKLLEQLHESLNEPLKPGFLKRLGVKNNDNTELFRPVVVYNPLTGTGKSTLAKYYALQDDFSAHYDHIGWVSITESFKNSFFIDLLNANTGMKFFEEYDIDRNFKNIVEQMNEIPGKNLLIIDNISTPQHINELIKYFSSSPWRIVALSYKEISGLKNLKIKPFTPYEANVKFKSIYKKEVEATRLSALNEHIGYHPFLTGFLAKVAQSNAQQLPVAKLHDLLIKQDRSTPHLTQFLNPDFSLRQMQRERKVLKYILAIYEARMRSYSRTQRKHLRWLSILPNIPLAFNDLCQLFKIKDKHKETFSDDLLFFMAEGWLTAYEKLFVMHPLVKIILQKKLKPNAKNCDLLIETITEQLNFANHEVPFSRKFFIPFGEALLTAIDDYAENISNLSNNLAIVEEGLGNFEQSLKYLQRTVAIEEAILEPDDLNLAVSYENIAISYSKTGDYKKELEFSFKALEIKKANYDDENEAELAISYKDIALVYRKMKKFDKALEYIDKALDILKELFPEEHPVLQEIVNVHEEISYFHKQDERLKVSSYWFNRIFK